MVYKTTKKNLLVYKMLLANLFTKPIFKLLVHVAILGFILINCIFTYSIWVLEKQIEAEIEDLAFLEQSKTDLANRQDYQNSDLFCFKERTSRFKIEGELIVDPEVEAISDFDPVQEYVVDLQPEQTSSLSYWNSCLFGHSNYLPSTIRPEDEILSLCKVPEKD